MLPLSSTPTSQADDLGSSGNLLLPPGAPSSTKLDSAIEEPDGLAIKAVANCKSSIAEPCFLCSLDTGRLNAETYKLFDDVEKRYNIRIEYTFPDAQETMDLVRQKGMFSFYEDGHQECCRVRKVIAFSKA